MIPRHLRDIDHNHLQSLIDAGVAEGQTLDFKRQIYDHSDKAKHSLLADVAAMANSRGGHIIFGVEEGRDEEGQSTGIAEKLIGLDGNLDQEKLWIQQVIGNGLEPTPVLDFRTVEGPSPDRPMLVMRIERVYRGPVMLRQSRRFYVRRDSQNILIDRLTDLRALFHRFDDYRNWIRRFRAERVATLVQGEGPLPSPDVPFLLSHLIPAESPDEELGLDIQSLQRAARSFPFFGGISDVINLDGVVTFPAAAEGEYGLAFRNGTLEFVIKVGIREEHGPPWIFGTEINKWVFAFLSGARRGYEQLGLSLPAYLCLALIGARDVPFREAQYQSRGTQPRIDRDPLIIPEVMLTEWVDRPEDCRGVLDLIWQAGGFPAAQFRD